jgi:tungstate transport system substrate-binding protein
MTLQTTRRTVLLSAAALAVPALRAQQRRPGEPLLLGVEALAEVSGLAAHLMRALAADTGLAVKRTAGDGPTLVAQCEQGLFDAVLTQAPQAEELMEKRGLVHSRRLVALGEYVIAGPAPKKPTKKGAAATGDPAGINGMNDAAPALARIAQAGAVGQCEFVSAGGNAGAQAAEAALWKAAGPQPAGAWLLRASGGPTAALQLAREKGAYVLVERGVFAVAGAGLAVLVQGDARLAAPYHVMQSFRVRHPGGKLLVNWLAGPNGRAAVAQFGRGYRPPQG